MDHESQLEIRKQQPLHVLHGTLKAELRDFEEVQQVQLPIVARLTVEDLRQIVGVFERWESLVVISGVSQRISQVIAGLAQSGYSVASMDVLWQAINELESR